MLILSKTKLHRYYRNFSWVKEIVEYQYSARKYCIKAHRYIQKLFCNRSSNQVSSWNFLVFTLLCQFCYGAPFFFFKCWSFAQVVNGRTHCCVTFGRMHQLFRRKVLFNVILSARCLVSCHIFLLSFFNSFFFSI